MFARQKKIEQYFNSLFAFYGYAGKPLQWQIGFRCGIEAVMRKLYAQLQTTGEVEGKRAYCCKHSGDNYLIVCKVNTMGEKYGKPAVVLMNADSGEIISVTEDIFAEHFE